MTGTLDKFNQIKDKNVRFIYLWIVEFNKKTKQKNSFVSRSNKYYLVYSSENCLLASNSEIPY